MGAFRRHARLSWSAALGLAGVLIGACTIIDTSKKPLEGERIAVMVQGGDLAPDPSLADRPVVVAEPLANRDWPTAGGGANHAPYHLELGEAPKRLFRADGGRGSNDDRRLLAQPVVDRNGRVYVMDAEARVSAFDGTTGERLWRRDLRPEDEREGTLGAGVAIAGKRLIATTGFAEVIAMEARTGKELWRRRLSAPFRAAPTVGEGRVFATSIDNRSYALDLATGAEIWRHRGTETEAALLGGAAPAYESGVVVVAYSSGEVFGLGAANGRELWSDFLAQARRTSAVGRIGDIRASPVIDRGVVFAVSNSGLMVATGLTNGVRLWQRRYSAIQTPWAAGAFIYLLTNDNVLLCLTRDDGRIRWGRSLKRYEDEERRRGWITWSGPVLAGDRLILAASNRDVISVSPYSGELLGHIRVPDGAEVPPVVARRTLYLLTSDAELIAWR